MRENSRKDAKNALKTLESAVKKRNFALLFRLVPGAKNAIS